MSGIVGILNLDGSPIDRQLLQKLTDSLAFRGPDAKEIWIDGHVGFGHTLLRTTEEAERENQPFTLDGETWIVADARVDAREDLTSKLRAHGHQNLAGAADVELLLRAYQVWGERCVDHLLGDFAFAIWDGSRQRLFCARDHLGVRPFYYAHLGSCVIFSNMLECVHLHPAVSDRLNDLAIADFLIFELNQDPAATYFADIQRIPQAHTATWSREDLRIQSYWTLPIEEPVFYKRADDYVDRFHELLREVVGDRLRTSQLSIFMSGGLDSTTLAATANTLMRERSPRFDLQALTKIDSFNPAEGQLAGEVARHLRIPIQFYKWDEEPVDPNWERIPFQTPQPAVNPWQVLRDYKYWKQVASHSRVFFWGEGPDSALMPEWRPYLRYLLRQHRYGRLFRDVFSTILARRRPPFWGRISRRLKAGGGPRESQNLFPAWVDPDLESRLQLRARWREKRILKTSDHPIHPEGYISLHTPLLQVLFEGLEPGWTHAAVEARHPYLDLRMIRFLLTVPALPWSRAKYLVRRAMANRLPDSVLSRTKSGTHGALITDWIGASGFAPLQPAAELNQYVDANRVPDMPGGDVQVFYEHLRVRSLNHWLQYSRQKPHNAPQEACDDFVSKHVGKTGREEAIQKTSTSSIR